MSSPGECVAVPGSPPEDNQLNSLKNELNAEVNIFTDIWFQWDYGGPLSRLFYLRVKCELKVFVK